MLTSSNGIPEPGSNSAPELIAAFIDGKLGPDERDQLLSLLNDDEEAYELFVGAIDYLLSEEERRAAALRRKRRNAAVAVIILVAAALLLFFAART